MFEKQFSVRSKHLSLLRYNPIGTSYSIVLVVVRLSESVFAVSPGPGLDVPLSIANNFLVVCPRD